MSDNYQLSDNIHRTWESGASSDDPLVTEYLLASRADNTRRAYDADLAHFHAWGGHLPSNPEEIARYLAQNACLLKPSTLRRRLAALAVVHKDAGLPDPTKHTLVRRVSKGVERRHGLAPRRVTPLLIGDLAVIVSVLGSSQDDLRDRALLLVGFFGALRRSELASLQRSDVETVTGGVYIILRRAKTDQAGSGRQIFLLNRSDMLCPVSALRRWLDICRPGGALFPAKEMTGHLSERSVARIIKKRAATVGFPVRSISGHSLRAGFATSAALAGWNTAVIACHTGHKTQQTLAIYVRPTTQELGAIAKEG